MFDAFRRLGGLGLFGVLLILAGLGWITYVAPKIGVGLAAIFAGTGLTIRALVSNLLGAWGMM